MSTEPSDLDVVDYAIHPVAALFPFIEGPAFDEFVEDIRQNGQREPVVLDATGRLLDGRNRARACRILGIEVKETRYTGDDATAWIISHNVHRRHLTESQRAMVAAKLANLRHGGQGGAVNPSIDGLTVTRVSTADAAEDSAHVGKLPRRASRSQTSRPAPAHTGGVRRALTGEPGEGTGSPT